MANNTSNSNFVNISQLTTVPELVDGDLLLVQTEQGTQTINFENLNVVKTDTGKNATIMGTTCAQDIFARSITLVSNISADSFCSNGRTGTDSVNGYYNKFIFTGGVCVSADYIKGSDEFTDIKTNFVPSVTAYLDSIFTRVYESYGIGLIQAGNQYVTITVSDPLPSSLTYASIRVQDLNIVLDPSYTAVMPLLSGMLYATNIVAAANNCFSFDVYHTQAQRLNFNLGFRYKAFKFF